MFMTALSKRVLPLLLGLTLASQVTVAVTLDLDDGTGPVSQLEVGRSLDAEIRGLAPGQVVDVVVRDGNGWPIVSASVVADPSGDAAVEPLWMATGVVGCDCGTTVGLFRFRRLEAALQVLPGSVIRVVVLDPSGVELASTQLALVSPNRPIGFPADATGCPRYRFQDVESVHWSVIGGAAGAQTDATVTSGLSGPLVEIRQIQPEGPTFALSGQQVQVVQLWPGQATTPGSYRVMGSGRTWPLPSELAGGPINSGLVVTDHSCPPLFP